MQNEHEKPENGTAVGGRLERLVSLSQLQRGDIVRHRSSGDSMVVTANYGNRVTAVRTVDITNPTEWLKLTIYGAKL